RPLWATRSVAADHRLAAATASADVGLHNDVAKLNARRLALPSSLADRLLAGIVPTTTPTLGQASASAGTATAAARNGATYAGNG
ncbi:flagellar assembly peptidoglycan hydrolase FlgJ, partial [Pseudomonas sp. CCC2.2]|nr:flagellar assembly peptidoglycan hydrolase FlgJ [Pseudomonas sp. CCC2.2]